MNDQLRSASPTHPARIGLLHRGREGITDAEPGTVKGLQPVVKNIGAAHDHLASRGVAVSDIEHLAWGSFVYFSYPDGNAWAVQCMPAR